MKLFKSLTHTHSSRKNKASSQQKHTTTKRTATESTPAKGDSLVASLRENVSTPKSLQSVHHMSIGTPARSPRKPIPRTPIRSLNIDKKLELTAFTLPNADRSGVSQVVNNNSEQIVDVIRNSSKGPIDLHSPTAIVNSNHKIATSSQSPRRLLPQEQNMHVHSRSQSTPNAIGTTSTHPQMTRATLTESDVSRIEDWKNRWSGESSTRSNFLADLQLAFPNFEYYLENSVFGSPPNIQPQNEKERCLEKDLRTNSLKVDPNRGHQRDSRNKSVHTPNKRESIQRNESHQSEDSLQVSTPSSLINASAELDKSSLLSLEDVSMDYVATPVNKAKKLTFPDMDNERLNSQLKQFCQKQSKEIEELHKKIENLKRFKQRMEKCQDLSDLLYNRATELMCEGWMIRNKEKDKSRRSQYFGMGLDYLKAAALLNHAQAQFEYAEFLIQHYKMEEESSLLQEAIRYLNLAQVNGHAKAGVFLNKMRQYMLPQ